MYQFHDGGGLDNSYYQGPANYAAPPVAMGMPPTHMVQQGPPHPSGHYSPGEENRPASKAWKAIGVGLLVTGAVRKALPPGTLSKNLAALSGR